MPGRGIASARDRSVGPTLHRVRVVAQWGASEVSGTETHGAWTTMLQTLLQGQHTPAKSWAWTKHVLKRWLWGQEWGMDWSGERGDRACGDTGVRGLSG